MMQFQIQVHLMVIWSLVQATAYPTSIRSYGIDSNSWNKTAILNRHDFMAGDKVKKIQVKIPEDGGEMIGITSVESKVPHYVLDYDNGNISSFPNPNKPVSVKVPKIDENESFPKTKLPKRNEYLRYVDSTAYRGVNKVLLPSEDIQNVYDLDGQIDRRELTPEQSVQISDIEKGSSTPNSWAPQLKQTVSENQGEFHNRNLKSRVYKEVFKSKKPLPLNDRQTIGESFSRNPKKANTSVFEPMKDETTNIQRQVHETEPTIERPEWLDQIERIEAGFLLSGHYDGVVPKRFQSDDEDFEDFFSSGLIATIQSSNSSDNIVPSMSKIPPTASDIDLNSNTTNTKSSQLIPADHPATTKYLSNDFEWHVGIRNHSRRNPVEDGTISNSTVITKIVGKFTTLEFAIILTMQIIVLLFVFIVGKIVLDIVKLYKEQLVKTKVIYKERCNSHGLKIFGVPDDLESLEDANESEMSSDSQFVEGSYKSGASSDPQLVDGS